MLLVSTMWYDGGVNVGTTEKDEKTLEFGGTISKGCQFAIHLILYSVRIDGCHVQISACDAIDLYIFHMMQFA